DLLARHGLGVLPPQQVLEQNLEGVGEPRDVVPVLQRVEPEDLVLAPAHGERRPRAEAVRGLAHPRVSLARELGPSPRLAGRSWALRLAGEERDRQQAGDATDASQPRDKAVVRACPLAAVERRVHLAQAAEAVADEEETEGTKGDPDRDVRPA